MRWLALVLVACVVSTAAAAPTVDIKAQTRLALEKVKLRGDGNVEVTGQLLDKLTSEGIAGGQTVQVRMGDTIVSITSEPDGHFRAVFTVAIPGPQPIELRFAGAAHLDKADPVTIVTDPSRAQVTLIVRSEPAVGGMKLFITTTVEDTKASLPVQIAVAEIAATQLVKIEKAVPSDQPYLLTRAKAGGPGPKRVRVTFPGDASKQQATAETTFELASTTTTTMNVADTSLAFEDDIVVSGKVTDEDGKPVARAAVALLTGDRRLAQSATEDDGTYKFKVEAEILAQDLQLPRDFGVQVQAEPSSTFVRSSKSNPTIVKIAAPQPVPVSYTVVAFLATALAAGGFFTARAKPWQRFRKPAAPAEGNNDEAVAIDVIDGGLVANKPGLVSTLRRPHDEGFSGAVRDTVRGRPVGDAVVRLTFGDQEREVTTGADGTFAIENLPLGEWRAEVVAPGHVTERFSVSIPHRGELRGVRVDLVPVRERVFQLYRRAAEPSLPEARLWGIWSPRQIVDHVRSKRPSPILAELTDFVEEIYFSPRMASETVLTQASERVDRAMRERSAKTSAAV
ncbi:MAG: carboxypeptidase-like regulatory domain-containing protein [Kofleriaceae bacterium]